MNDFRTDKKFDRIVSVEMFEHMRNYAKLFELIHGWLEDQGQLFFMCFVTKIRRIFSKRIVETIGWQRTSSLEV